MNTFYYVMLEKTKQWVTSKEEADKLYPDKPLFSERLETTTKLIRTRIR